MAVAGLYDPRFEHDACGVGFVADLSGRGGHDVVARAGVTRWRSAEKNAMPAA